MAQLPWTSVPELQLMRPATRTQRQLSSPSSPINLMIQILQVQAVQVEPRTQHIRILLLQLMQMTEAPTLAQLPYLVPQEVWIVQALALGYQLVLYPMARRP
tara:strand:+ start:240 stop:545 length:306 start_codon:yes stop_codon:yes gene_type:complete